MYKNCLPVTLLLRSLMVLALIAPASSAASGEFIEGLRHRLEVLHMSREMAEGGDVLYANAVLRRFYDGRGYEPLWFDGDRVRRSLDQLYEAIAAAEEEGLDPSHYHLETLQNLLAEVHKRASGKRDVRLLTDIELLASDAFLALAKHYANGKVDPTTVDPGWFLSRVDSVLLPLLSKVGTGETTPGEVLAELLPQQPAYHALRERLALQRALDDTEDWAPIADGPTMRQGDEGPRVAAVRQRLLRLDDLDEEHPLTEHFDAELDKAVRHFQARHGLDSDGAIGPRTLAEFNVAPARRIASLRANMERWRWLPEELGEEHILVNIAAFYMDVVKGDERVMRQRVIVGKPYRRTPVFSGSMTYLVFNPSWEVPHRLAVQDQLPQIRKDPEYLQRMGFTVLQGWGAQEQTVDSAGIDWASLGPRNFPYRLRQRPGPQNALGQVKFMFPNRHSVYLHDTPARGLFAREDRAFSSGCIRIEAPMALAEWLLAGEGRPQVTKGEQIYDILDKGVETTVRLGRAIPVHLLYWTAWIEKDSVVHYRADIYERDDPLIESLNEVPPKAFEAQ